MNEFYKTISTLKIKENIKKSVDIGRRKKMKEILVILNFMFYNLMYNLLIKYEFFYKSRMINDNGNDNMLSRGICYTFYTSSITTLMVLNGSISKGIHFEKEMIYNRDIYKIIFFQVIGSVCSNISIFGPIVIMNIIKCFDTGFAFMILNTSKRWIIIIPIGIFVYGIIIMYLEENKIDYISISTLILSQVAYIIRNNIYKKTVLKYKNTNNLRNYIFLISNLIILIIYYFFANLQLIKSNISFTIISCGYLSYKFNYSSLSLLEIRSVITVSFIKLFQKSTIFFFDIWFNESETFYNSNLLYGGLIVIFASAILLII